MNDICEWCGLPAGEIRPQCSDGLGHHTHGLPKPRAKTVPTQALAELLELMATRRANANLKPRASCVHMGCATGRCEEGPA